MFANQVDAGRFTATTDFSVIAELDTINICVPTPLRKMKPCTGCGNRPKTSQSL